MPGNLPTPPGMVSRDLPADHSREHHDELPAVARRALAEAEERRRRAAASTLPVELGGRNGPEPVRFGDWERKGIAVDF